MKKYSLQLLVLLFILLACEDNKEYENPIAIPAVDDITSVIRDAELKKHLEREISLSLKEYDTQAPYGILSSNEAAKITVLHLEDVSLGTLDGIEYFVGLEELYLKNTRLTELKLYNNAKLRVLEMDESKVKKIDLGLNPLLQRLNCPNSADLISLRLENCKALEILDCSNTKLSILDLRKCTILRELTVKGTPMVELDISKNKKLGKFYGNQSLEKLYTAKEFRNIKDLELSENTVIFERE